jgi:hypothetical protein
MSPVAHHGQEVTIGGGTIVLGIRYSIIDATRIHRTWFQALGQSRTIWRAGFCGSRAIPLYDPIRQHSVEETSPMTTTTESDELVAHLAATTTVAKLGSDDGLALPAKIKQAAGLGDGDTLYVEAIDQGDGVIRVHLRKIDPDQLWGWTPESQAAIRESEENYAAGRSTFYESDEEFLTALDKRTKQR